jgi:hypothetical protein
VTRLRAVAETEFAFACRVGRFCNALRRATSGVRDVLVGEANVARSDQTSEHGNRTARLRASQWQDRDALRRAIFACW